MFSVGIDFGTSSCCVATCIDGKVEVISNEHDKRLTPSYVAFTEDERLFGDAAKHQAPLNVENTLYQTKRIVGRKQIDGIIGNYEQFWGFKIDERNQKLEIPITFRENQYVLQPEQASAMILEKMKQVAEEYIEEQVYNAVITAPDSFSNEQKNAIKDAGIIAGFKRVEIMDETEAAAIAFAENRNSQDVRNILIFKIGAGTFETAIYSIEHDYIKHLFARNGDPNFGGDDFDKILIKHIREKAGANNPTKKSLCRLRAACEKAKKSLSNAARTRLQVDNLIGNETYVTTVTREDFEELLEHKFKVVQNVLTGVFGKAGMKPNEIHDIVLVGGSSRIPKIRQILQNFCDGKQLNRTINPDEAIAIGAAYYAGNRFGAHGVSNTMEESVVRPEIQRLIELNKFFDQGDEELRNQSEARNDLENCVYRIKQEAKKSRTLDEKRRNEIMSKCDYMINWLDSEGQNASTEKVHEKKEEILEFFKKAKRSNRKRNDPGEVDQPPIKRTGEVNEPPIKRTGEVDQPPIKRTVVIPNDTSQELNDFNSKIESIEDEVKHEFIYRLSTEDKNVLSCRCKEARNWMKNNKNASKEEIEIQHKQLNTLFDELTKTKTKNNPVPRDQTSTRSSKSGPVNSQQPANRPSDKPPRPISPPRTAGTWVKPSNPPKQERDSRGWKSEQSVRPRGNDYPAHNQTAPQNIDIYRDPFYRDKTGQDSQRRLLDSEDSRHSWKPPPEPVPRNEETVSCCAGLCAAIYRCFTNCFRSNNQSSDSRNPSSQSRSSNPESRRLKDGGHYA